MDWNEPTNSNPAHPNVLADLNSKDSYCATMGQTNAGFTNIPEGAMNWDHGSKFFRRKEGGAFLPVQISLSGGGTGASDAAGARTALEVNKAGQGTAEARTNQQNDQVYCQLSRSINTASPLQGGGQLDSDVNLSIQDATTAQKGAVQLDNTLTSTSTAKALTAAQGKVLSEKITNDINSLTRQSVITSLGGDFTSGEITIEKVGNIISITGYGNHTSTSTPSTGSIIPVWAYPKSNSVGTIYLMDNTVIREVRVSTALTNISFDYRNWSGLSHSSSFTTGFNITYVTFG